MTHKKHQLFLRRRVSNFIKKIHKTTKVEVDNYGKIIKYTCEGLSNYYRIFPPKYYRSVINHSRKQIKKPL